VAAAMSSGSGLAGEDQVGAAHAEQLAGPHPLDM
jgi:hypothetical protein